MSRYSQQGSSRRFAFPACLAVLALLAVLPSRLTMWLTGVSGVARFAIAPIQEPVYHLARWLSPGRGTKVDDPLVGKEREEKERFQALWLREQQRVAELERRIAELQHGVLVSEVPVRQVATTVIGHASEPGGELLIRAGSSQGVEANNVVTAGGVQIVGRVSRAGSRTSQVRLLTDRSTGKVMGVVMTGEGSTGPTCSLTPGNGVLAGPVEYRSGDPEIHQGQLVRLLDSQWPRSASMLVLGEVVSVELLLGRPVITVRPTLDLQRLSEVVARTNPDEAEPTREGSAATDKSNEKKPGAGGAR